MKKHAYALTAALIALGWSLQVCAQPTATLLWAQHPGGPLDDESLGSAADASGNLYVVGTVGDSLTWNDYVVLKYNPNGRLIWRATYNGPNNKSDQAKDFIVDAAGNVYVTGCIQLRINAWPPVINDLDYATVKFNSQGQQEWVATYGSPRNDYDVAEAIALDEEGNVYVTGSSKEFGGGSNQLDILTIKYDDQGRELWTARYNGPFDRDDEAADLTVDAQGNAYIVGHSDNDSTGGNDYNEDYRVLKYDPQGQLLWSASYDAAHGSDVAQLVTLDSQDNVIVTGRSSTTAYPVFAMDLYTIKYNGAGVEQWAVRTSYLGGTNSSEHVKGLHLDGVGNVILTGKTQCIGEIVFYLIAKYNSSGSLLWLQADDFPPAISGSVLDVSGNIYFTGQETSPGNNTWSCLTRKTDPQGNTLWFARYTQANQENLGRQVSLDGLGNVVVTGIHVSMHLESEDFMILKYAQPPAGNDGIPPSISEPAQPLSCNPNPFNPSTVIRYQMPDARYVSLRVYDTAGRLVATLVNGMREAGEHHVTFEGAGLAGGIYLYRLTVSGSGPEGGLCSTTPTTMTGKMVLIK